MSERRERGGGTKRRGIGGKEEEGTLLISFAPPTSEPWRRHCSYVIHLRNSSGFCVQSASRSYVNAYVNVFQRYVYITADVWSGITHR